MTIRSRTKTTTSEERAAVVEELDDEIGPRDQHRFVTVLRGYDRIEVDECLKRIAASVAALHSELAEEQQSRREINARGPSDVVADNPAPGQVETGFGARAERLLRLAHEEADAMRADAARQVATLIETERAKAEQVRHATEQDFIERSSAFDQETAQRVAELQQREQHADKRLAEIREQVDSLRAATRGEIDAMRQQAQAEVATAREHAMTEIARERQQAGVELERLLQLDATARTELQRLAEMLTTQLGKPPDTRNAASGESPAGRAKSLG